jgi:type III secretion protein D
MKRDRMLELRVLTGTHAGARALLAEQPQWIGRGDDCALILSDEGLLDQHARIEHRPDGTLLLIGGDEGQAPVIIRPGESTWVGPVRIAVAVLGSPWHDDPPLANAAATPEPETATDPPVQPPRPAWRTRWGACAVLALCAAATVLAWPLAQPLLSALSAGMQPTPPTPTPPAPQEPLGQLITRLGLKGRVTFENTDPQRPTVKAQLLSGEEVEALANELTQRQPRPQLTLIDEAQAVDSVTQGVRRLGELFDATLITQYLGAGRFRVAGQVAEAVQRDQLASDLQDAYPQVVAFEIAIGVRAQAAQAMVDELKRRGVAQLQGRWDQGLLTMDVRVPPGGLPQWEQALLAVASQYEVPFRARVSGQDIATDGANAPHLPFQVRSVVTTPLPYVVLSDGRKMATGGEIDGWRLLAIDARTVRFQGPQGHPLTLER